MKDLNDKNQLPEPTRSELEILQVLWLNGPSTVRFVNDTLNRERRAVQYTSTLKVMQLMAEKGFLKRDETNMKHIYIAVMDEEKTKNVLLDNFIDSIYNGSAGALMMQLLGNKRTSIQELDAIKGLLEKLEKAQ
jgi:BlaI family transcriptional regulator, penicillinase repressor